MSTPLDDDTLANGDVIETIQLTQLFPIVEALEDNQTNYRADIGVADAYKVDFSGTGQPNQIQAYQAGQQIVFKAAHTNTGASTLQVTGPFGDLSALALKKFGNTVLEAGDIQADQIVMAVFNNEGPGRFEVLGAPQTVAPPDPEDGTGFYRDDEGSADAYELDASGSGDNPRPVTALTRGQFFTFRAGQNNTGPSTLEVTGPGGSLGTKWITRQGEDLSADDIVAETMVAVLYNDEDGGRFELLGSSPASSGGGGGNGTWLYGDGMDGNGSFTYDDSLWEHKFYQDLTIDSGVSLCTNGFKIHVSGTLTNNGIIHNNGTDGEDSVGTVNGSPGHGGNYGSLAWEGHWGGAGSVQTGETVYTVDEQAYYARGGNGGDGLYGGGGSGEGSNIYGAARHFMVSAAYLSGIYDGDAAWTGARTIGGGMGGGGGTGDDDVAAGGSGGGSGNILWIAARALAGNGELQAKGGNGGQAGGTDAGGGGGGGGGIIYLLTDATSSPYTYNVDGGSGGLGGGGSGTNGGDGDSGLYVFRGGL